MIVFIDIYNGNTYIDGNLQVQPSRRILRTWKLCWRYRRNGSHVDNQNWKVDSPIHNKQKKKNT
jgi:hypothetical protein